MKYLAIARSTSLIGLVYERDVVLRSAFMVVALVVFIQLWTTTFAAAGVAALSALSLRDIIWYLVITETLGLSTPRTAQTIDTEVRGGDVAYRLSRPYSYPLYHLAAFWGETLVRLPLNFAVGSVVALLAVGPPSLSLGGVLGGLLSATVALTLVGLIQILIGLSAFWIEDTQPVEWIYAKFVFTLGGLFLPLDLFPDWLGAIARVLPFASTSYAPARLFIGFAWPDFAALLGTQVVWLIVIALTVRLVFANAARRVVAHGG